MSPTLITTKDGSHTLFVPELNEHYHSTNGAIAESMHVFIINGLEHIAAQKSTVRILEIGLGTGLNAALTHHYAQQHQLLIYYTAIEAFPLDNEVLQSINYPTDHRIDAQCFQQIHQTPWNHAPQQIAPTFLLEKRLTRLEDYAPAPRCFDLVYFDAFTPNVQPTLWEPTIFERLFHAIDDNGILVTYSAKGSVRRTMQAVGFSVERLPGALGKREMLRATKKTKTE